MAPAQLGEAGTRSPQGQSESSHLTPDGLPAVPPGMGASRGGGALARRRRSPPIIPKQLRQQIKLKHGRKGKVNLPTH